MQEFSPPLVLRFGAFGDMLLLLPFLRVLQQRYGQGCDLVASGPWTSSIFDGEASVRSLRLLSSVRAPYWFNADQRKLVGWLRTRAPGAVYLCGVSVKAKWLMRQAGLTPGWICSLDDLPTRPGENILERYHRFAGMTPTALAGHIAAAPAERPWPRITLTEQAQADLDSWLREKDLSERLVVLVQPGNKRTMRRGVRTRASNIKYWPEARWAEVIGAVCDSLPDAHVLICGSPQEATLAEDIRRHCASRRVLSVARELPIPRLLALQTRAHSMISVDTGPAHAAAAMGCPLVVLFSSAETAYYRPLPTTARVEVVHPGDLPGPDGFPMASLSAAQVIAAWRRLGATAPRAA